MSFQYQSAARIVEAAEKGKSLKAYCASMLDLRKSDYALAMQTLKYSGVIKEILDTIEDEELKSVKQSLLYVMLYEYLFGKGKIQGGGLVKRKIMQHSEALLAAKEVKMQGKNHHDELLSDHMKEAQDLPTYVRVNEAMLSIGEGLDMIRQNYAEAEVDDLVPSLVKLPKDSKGISQAEYIADGKCVLQDKASCFPSQILFNQYKHDLQTKPLSTTKQTKQQQPHTYFIDACSAPGNKTSHLAALLLSHHREAPKKSTAKQQGKTTHTNTAIPATIYACDKSTDRVQLLKRRMQQYAVDKIMKIKHQDFMAIDINESSEHYAEIEYVLLDPSCSGSGIVRNIERVIQHKKNNNNNNKIEEGEDEEDDGEGNGSTGNKENRDRVLKLQAFQFSILQKALSFPNVQIVVYSTCSIHEEENEEVVVKTLQSNLGKNWQLIAPMGFESWTRRGHVIDGLNADDAAKLIRCLPSDGMNGFFVALFRRNPGVTAKDIPEYVPSHAPTVHTSHNTTSRQQKRNEHNNTQSTKAATINKTNEESSEKKQGKKQKRPLESVPESQTIEQVPTKKAKQEVIPKKEKPQKIATSTSTSLFAPRFQVSKTKKRNFHKRK